MRLQTVVRDCLYLNWAVPREALADPPRPLRFECHPNDGRSWVFVSALLFHQSGLRIGPLPLPGLSYPQVNIRSYVRDGAAPGVLFHRMLVPAWVSPAVRWLSGLPGDGARLRLPRPSLDPDAEVWRFSARTRAGTLAVAVRLGSPRAVGGPDLGAWATTTEYFRLRDRGFARSSTGLRRIETVQEPVAVWPLLAEVADDDLVAAALGCKGEFEGVLHSAWLCPEIPLRFVMGRLSEPVLSRQVPAPG